MKEKNDHYWLSCYPILMRQLGIHALLLVLGACTTLSPETRHERFTFAAWGDAPYLKNHDRERISGLIQNINKAEPAFSIFVGDIKDGSSPCSDEIYDSTMKRFNQMEAPVVYIPGDNEWTDCHRASNGAYDPLERLDFIRKVFFSKPLSLGQKTLDLTQQGIPGSTYAENVRWQYKSVLFVGLNVPGSNNNHYPDLKQCMLTTVRTEKMCAEAQQEYLLREQADITWLKAAFRIASEDHLPGLVIVMHADPGFDHPETDTINERDLPQYSGYNRLISVMTEETSKFSGQVLLIHGDSHYFLVDKPLESPLHLLPNFTRLETFGSPNLHWVSIKVDPEDHNLFHMDPMLTPNRSLNTPVHAVQ